MSGYKVDRILENWFGGSADCFDNQEEVMRHLYFPLRKLEDELEGAKRLIAQLESELAECKNV